MLYSILFLWGYVFFLNFNFEYAGYEINSDRLSNSGFIIYTLVMCLIPLYFYTGVRAISSFICIFIYYLLYIPIQLTYFIDFDHEPFYVKYIQLLFLFGMSILFLADRVSFKKTLVLPANINYFKAILVLTLLSTFYMLIKYKGSLSFVAYEDVYDLRSMNSEIGADVFTSYISSWLAYMMIPVCFTYGLFSNNKNYIVVAIIASLTIYMSIASKTALVFPIVIYCLFKTLKNKDMTHSFNYIGLGLIVILFISLQFDFNVITSLIWMRTIGNSGSLTMHYHYFFEDHPHTYFSHINIVNYFTDIYPYKTQGVGQVVGNHYWSSDMNANANFWATDGIAALGDIGIIFSSILLFLIFVVFNRIARNYNLLFLILILIPFISSLLNMSLFSSLLTGGAIFIFIILTFQSSHLNKYINENTNSNRC